ncbi:MAG: hypothetical protein Q8Q09_21750 [Deltaproteobacteria bacterium]|nr:hypothetical protein [Deltaproteobacteria bacterium]
MPNSRERPRSHTVLLAAMGAIAGSGIALQVSLTRLFSLVVWYHFAFLAISIAMLGLSLGGLVAARWASDPTRSAHRDASQASSASAAMILLLLLALPRMPFYQSILASPGQLALFVLLILMVLAPFTGIGLAIARTLSAEKSQAGRLYGADLAGSGLAGALAVVAMNTLGGGAGGAAMAALLASLASLGFDLANREHSAHKRAHFWPGAALVVLSVVYGAIARDPLNPLVYAPNAKLFPRVERAQTLARECTAIACVDFFSNPLHLGMWGREGVDPNLPEQVGIVIDGWAVTSIVRGHQNPDRTLSAHHPVFDRLPTALPQQVRRATRRSTNNTLIIGAGGGLDVRSALHHGVPHVDAIEINPSIYQGVNGRFSDFSGRIFSDPRVNVVLGEGRSVLERTAQHYDVVQLSGVDTYAASQAGAFALTENYLYTVQAIRAYLDRLTPDGTLTLTRWLYHPDRQTIRLAATIDRATREAGLGDAGPRMVIAATPAPGSDMDFSIVLVQKEPWSARDLRTLRVLCQGLGYRIAWSPDGGTSDPEFAGYFGASDRTQWLADYPFRIEPTTDDAPFFFEHTRLRHLLSSRDQILGSASGQLVLLISASIVALLGAALWFATRKLAPTGALRPQERGYFVALGAAYLAVESALIPRVTQFLGYPTYALTVVLCALLLGSGLGSALTQRSRRTARTAALSAAATVALVALALPKVLALASPLQLGARVAIAALLVGAIGFVLGAPFPLGLRALSNDNAPESTHTARVLHAWVLNGIASSVQGVLALVLAIELGFTAILWLAALAYVLAALASPRAPTPSVPQAAS